MCLLTSKNVTLKTRDRVRFTDETAGEAVTVEVFVDQDKPGGACLTECTTAAGRWLLPTSEEMDRLTKLGIDLYNKAAAYYFASAAIAGPQ